MAEQDLIRIARESIEAFNSGDWTKFRQTMTPDSIYEEFATQRRVQGADAIIQVNEEWRRAFPDARGTVKSACASGDEVVLEIVWEGTQSGPLPGPGGEIPASGKRVTVPAVQVMTFAGDRTRETRHYFNLLTILQQIGVSPMAGAGVG